MPKENSFNRRIFLKTIGAAGLGAALTSVNAQEEKQTASPVQVPRRILGKTGIEVPVLGLGANRLDNQIVLRSAYKWGVRYWDTAHNYVGGNSESNIGKFIGATQDCRKNIFLVTKASQARSTEELENRLQTSLKRMNTDYIDLYYGVHGLANPTQLTNELKQWVEGAKKRGLIRFFGFSTHKNMAKNLTAAAKAGWVDAVMTSYNFRLMQDKKMLTAVDTCDKAGIGLIAMKVVGLSFTERKKMQTGEKITTADDKKLIASLLEKGFTEEQARIKYVLEDERISSACVGVNNIGLLLSNTAAALDKTKLTDSDKKQLARYAKTTCNRYCAGCAAICDSALPDMPYTSDIIRFLMYHNSYGDRKGARQLFAEIPAKSRQSLLNINYKPAEALCPQKLAITKLIREAVLKLT